MKTTIIEILFGNDYEVKMISVDTKTKNVLGIRALSAAHAIHKAVSEMRALDSICSSVDYIKKL